MEKNEPPICLTCSAKLTIKHIFDECRIYQIQREELNISHDKNFNIQIKVHLKLGALTFFKNF